MTGEVSPSGADGRLPGAEVLKAAEAAVGRRGWRGVKEQGSWWGHHVEQSQTFRKAGLTSFPSPDPLW